MGKRAFPTRDTIERHLDFCPSKGTFLWGRPTGHRTKPGSVAGCQTTNGYLWITIFGQRFSAHQLAWIVSRGEPPPAVIDHINGDRSDNRPENLRAATPSQNAANAKAHSDNSCGKKGVHRHYDGRWRAQIMVDGRRIHLGCFNDPDEAHTAYRRAAEQHFGEFSNAGGYHR